MAFFKTTDLFLFGMLKNYNLISTKKHKKVRVMPDAKNLRALCDLIEDGKIFPNIEKIYPSPRRR
jgi:hypothetical protein